MINMLRDAGYKNTSYAIAEIVDNSIEANAKNINITLFGQSNHNSNATFSKRSCNIRRWQWHALKF